MRRLLLCACLLLTGCQQNEKIQRVWVAPPGQWGGLELRAIDTWGGVGPNRRLAEQFLEVRCTKQAGTPLRRSYWPGPDWSGIVVWNAVGVTYLHGTRNPHIQNLTFQAAEIRQAFPCALPENHSKTP